MADATLRNFVFAFIIAAAVGVGLFAMAQDLSSEYNTGLDDNMTRIWQGMNNSLLSSYDTASNLQNDTERAEGFSAVTDLGIAVTIWNVIKLPFDLLDGALDFLGYMAQIIPLPRWFVIMLMSILSATIAFLALSALLRKDT